MEKVAVSTKDGLIRWSRIRAEMGKGGASKLADEIAKLLQDEDPTCDEHGKVDDPIIGMEGATRSLCWACPYCAGPEVLALWEAQGNG